MALSAGDRLGRYEILAPIGAGGMGEVYRARDERLDRDVAVKVLPEEVIGVPERLKRFEREARAVAKLDHPNILAIHDFRSEEGTTYAVMELLEGESLRESISRGDITPHKAVEYARAIADGLAAAHGKNIIHRDLKPENVFLTTDGRIKILDFGLAKLNLPEGEVATETASETLDTTPGTLLGTIAYMAPEQLQGKAADHRSDIFALGVVLYEMLAGRRPFGGGTAAEVAAEIIKADPAPISEPVPSSLAGVISKCLEKRPEDRFSSAHDLSLILGSIDSNSTATPSRENSCVRRRWPYLVAGIIVAIIALVLLLRPGGLVERSVEQPAEAAVPRIVVLPFDNLGPAEDEYFADGMTEEITSRLSAVSGLQVISRTSAVQYKNTGKAIRQIGEELNVQYALEGTVRWERAGEGRGRVRITPQLIEVAGDRHLWSDRYDRAIESVFEVQSDIAEQVVGQLHVSLLKPEQEALIAIPTDSSEAYDAYLRGLYHYTQLDFESTELAAVMCERAVELDPEFARAWAYLARAHAQLYLQEWDPSAERRAAAKRAAEKALQLDPALPEGHWALGEYYYRCERDYERALTEYAQVLSTQPNHVGALSGRAYVLRRQGRWDESINLFKRVLELSPRDCLTASDLSASLRMQRDFRRAEEYADLAISLAPDRQSGYLNKFAVLLRQGRLRDAREVFEAMPMSSSRMELMRIVLDIAAREFDEALARVHDTPEAVFEQAWGPGQRGQRDLYECRCYFFLGDRQGIEDACGRACAAFEEASRLYPEAVNDHNKLGLAYAYLGRKDEAIDEGERSVAMLPVSVDAADAPEYVECLAEIYSIVGEPEAAIDQLEYLLSIPNDLTVGYLRVHPYYDSLRDNPRFQALLEENDTN